jgi:hypothetical protein
VVKHGPSKCEALSSNLSTAKKENRSQALVAHTCNSNYPGGKDQEDRDSKPTWANSSARTYLKKKKKNLYKRLVEWLKVKALNSNPSTTKKKKKEK